ncbi:5-(carboxyamino)imidazole ribonucleotide synthase [Neobacillus notoginsengisoli]|uniref:N5-carboxyaminoimidazole ribonucleotide synthase n=1 Tax=Neobacillus notoginsengisoli TaxID=1578198 RepID=A0A417YE55_9BACI|nr:5-(carboxyamino)imidazole ribonucleotide synthase [Neobacillus notoginsengisoli]RHW30942.1 5-(carboxyamino)imidazole ribonucleotide synthase [Neobacillus notoginsengisoli]
MSRKVILPGGTIGIIGGGQLGRMMALSAKAMGYRVAVLDPTPESPCGQVADDKIIAPYSSQEAMEQLAERSDVITYEFENIDEDALENASRITWVPQGSELLKVAKDRIAEKETITSAGLPVAPYYPVKTEQELIGAADELGFPFVIKTATGGYDGKGQVVVKDEQILSEAAGLLSQGPCVIEKWLSFAKEISVIITRNTNRETAVFPVAENIHENNILHQTIVPARISDLAEKKAIELAVLLANALELVGTLAVEMFLMKDDSIFINEIAPRPHNSGHYTIEACETSQFTQHIRAICNLPLGSTALHKPAVMVNVLGEHQEKLLTSLPGLRDWNVHLYGKNEAKTGRKMGHATLIRSSVDEALQEIEHIGIWPKKRIAAIGR